MLTLALVTSLLLGQGSTTMAGPQVRALSTADYFATFTGDNNCGCGALTMTDGTSISTTRASTASCTQTDGTIVSCGTNVARVSGSGLLSEAAATNLVIQNQALDTWTCTSVTAPTANTIVSPTGATDAESLAGTGAGGYCESAGFVITGTSAAVAAYAQAASGTQAVGIRLRDTTAGVDRCTGAYTTTTAWSKKEGATDTRPRCAASGTIVSGNTHTIRVYPGDVAGTGTARFWGAGAEVGVARVSTNIPTVATSVTRSADAISVSPSTSIDAEGCFSAIATYGEYPGTSRWATTNGGSLLHGNSSTELSTHDNANTVTRAVAAMADSAVTARSGWVSTTQTLESGGNTSTGLFDGTKGINPIYLGSTSGTSAWLNGHLANIKLGTSSTGCQP